MYVHTIYAVPIYMFTLIYTTITTTTTTAKVVAADHSPQAPPFSIQLLHCSAEAF